MKPAVKRAWAAFELRRFDEAVRLAEFAVAADPNVADGYLILGKALHGVGRTEDALRALERATSLAPHWARPHVVRSDILAARSENESALDAADEAVRLDPAGMVGHLARAYRLKALQRTAEAIEAADMALSIEPDSASVLSARGDVVLYSNPREAMAYYRQSLAIDPTCAGTLNNLGVAFQQLDRLDEAAKAFRDALRANPMLDVAQRNLRRWGTSGPSSSTASTSTIERGATEPSPTEHRWLEWLYVVMCFGIVAMGIGLGLMGIPRSAVMATMVVAHVVTFAMIVRGFRA